MGERKSDGRHVPGYNPWEAGVRAGESARLCHLGGRLGSGGSSRRMSVHRTDSSQDVIDPRHFVFPQANPPAEPGINKAQP